MIRAVVDGFLEVMSAEFDGFYARAGRPLMAPERLLWALFLQVSYGVHSERQQMDYNMLFG